MDGVQLAHTAFLQNRLPCALLGSSTEHRRAWTASRGPWLPTRPTLCQPWRWVCWLKGAGPASGRDVMSQPQGLRMCA